MRWMTAYIISITMFLFMGHDVALGWDDITWDEICGADVAIMPEQLLNEEIASCGSGGIGDCIYLAEMFDMTNPEWYVVDAIPQGWEMDGTNKDWLRKAPDQIKVRKAGGYLPEVLDVYIRVIEMGTSHAGDLPTDKQWAFDLIYRVTGRTFTNTRELKKWEEMANLNEAGTLTAGRESTVRSTGSQRASLQSGSH
jgi:hypothetical protein